MSNFLNIHEHLVFYRKYHFNQTNVAIHLCCIPLILLSAIAFSSTKPILGESHPFVTTGSVVAWVYGLYYTALDWQLGLPSLVFLASYTHIVRSIYLHLGPHSPISQTQFVQIAVGVHIVCWLAQFYGHAFYERRAPALVDNLLQALVLAPFFVVYEIAFWMGYKLDVKKEMDNKAGVLVLEMNRASKQKKLE